MTGQPRKGGEMDPVVARLVELERQVREEDPDFADAIIAFMEAIWRHLEKIRQSDLEP